VSPPVYQALLGWPANKTAVNSFVTYTINWEELCTKAWRIV
jgi:hypothetical protein